MIERGTKDDGRARAGSKYSFHSPKLCFAAAEKNPTLFCPQDLTFKTVNVRNNIETPQYQKTDNTIPPLLGTGRKPIRPELFKLNL